MQTSPNMLMKKIRSKLPLAGPSAEIMNQYEIQKEKAREEAINWQHDFANHDYSLEELAKWREHFYTLAKQYGLIHEFQDNGVI